MRTLLGVLAATAALGAPAAVAAPAHGCSTPRAYAACVVARPASLKGNKAAIAHKLHAAKSCRTEQKAEPAAFRARYGAGTRKTNAFGRCVSAKAKAKRKTGTARS